MSLDNCLAIWKPNVLFIQPHGGVWRYSFKNTEQTECRQQTECLAAFAAQLPKFRIEDEHEWKDAGTNVVDEPLDAGLDRIAIGNRRRRIGRQPNWRRVICQVSSAKIPK